MATIERRITDLEAKTACVEENVKVVFCEDGQTAAQARRAAGVPKGYRGKVICVQFVEAHANKTPAP